MDQVEEIKQKVDIVDLIGSYIDLKKAGASYKANCPFHQEKTPSFMVNPDRQIFKCFGCGEGGDIFTFVEKIEGVDFSEALKILADRAGVKLKKVDKKVYDQKRILYEINSLAAKVYHHVLLNSSFGKQALEYLEKRGLKRETIKEFELGYAPENFEFISSYLLKKGFREIDIQNAGLALESRQKRNDQLPIFDRFRGRVMFPLTNPAGNIVGFSARLLKEKENEGKYINTPETAIFSKSRTIFGYDKARNEIRKKGFLVLAEGQMDVVLSHQAGFKNTVATSGTALTEEQIKQLSRICQKFIFAFDKDEAGAAATKKGIDLALQAGIDALIVTPPSTFKDAAEVIQKDKSLWTKSLKSAKPYINYLLEISIKNKALSPEEKRDIASIILPEIAKLENPVLIGEYISKLAARIGTEEKYLYETLQKVEEAPFRSASYEGQARGRQAPDNNQSAIANQIQQASRESHLIGLLLVFSDNFKEAKGLIKLSDFRSEQVKSIYKKLLKCYPKKGKFDINRFVKKLKKYEQDFVDLAILNVENEYLEDDEELAQKEIIEIINTIKKDKMVVEKKDFAQRIKEAEERGDKGEIKKLIRKFQELIIKK